MFQHETSLPAVKSFSCRKNRVSPGPYDRQQPAKKALLKVLETKMDEDVVQRVKSDPNYQKLVKTRSRYGWMLTWAVMIVYYGFTCLNAFDKEFMGSRIGDGVMSWGVPLGLFVIVFTVAVTGIYVRRANSEFDALTEAIQRNAAGGNDSGATPIKQKVRA
jgi:uncharacterized membrane protein (DUF485 family)